MNETATLALEDAIRRLPRISKAAYMPAIKKHLSSGADPNATPFNGKKSIMVMALDWDFPMKLQQRIEVLSALIAQGGNPLLHPSLLTNFISKSFYLDQLIFDALRMHEENETPLLGKKGDNLLHLQLIESTLIESMIEKMSKNKDTSMCVKWMQQENHESLTPLHVMWKHLNSTYLFNAWQLTRLLQAKGVSLDGPGNFTVRMAIHQRLKTVDLNLVKEEHSELGSEIMAWVLEKDTQPSQSIRLGRRL